MTACRNKARGAVVAALAGALTLGAAPVMALADGASLMAAGADQAFDAGTVAEYTIGGKVVKGSQDAGSFSKADLADYDAEKDFVKITSVTPDAAGADNEDATELNTYYFRQVKKDEATHQINGEWYKYVCSVSDFDSSKFTVGSYLAVVNSDNNITEDRADNAAPAVTFTVTSDSLTGAKLMKPVEGVEGEWTDQLTWEAGKTWTLDDLDVVLDGEAIDDEVSVEVFADGQDGDNLMSKSITPGTYKVVIKGAEDGDYEGARETQTITVSKLDLSKLGLYIDDVTDDVAPDFSKVKGDGAEKIGAAWVAEKFDLKPADGKTWGADGNGEYSYELSVKADVTFGDSAGSSKLSDLVEGTAELTFNRVDEDAVEAAWTYDGKPAPSKVTVNASADKESTEGGEWTLKSLDLSKFAGSYTADDEKTDLAEGEYDVTVLDADGNEVEGLSKKGSYTVVLEAKPSELDWMVQRSRTEIEVTVMQGVVGFADTTFTFDGKVVTDLTGGNAVTYSGTNVLDRLGIQVKSGDEVLTEGDDYEVTVENAKGEEVDSVVDKGEYTVTVSSDAYQINGITEGTEQLKITVSPFALSPSNTRVTFPTAITYYGDTGEVDESHLPIYDDITFIPYTGEEIASVIEVALTKDEEGEPVWTTLDSSLYELSCTRDSKAADAIKETGTYTVTVSVDGKATENLEGSQDFSTFFKGDKNVWTIVVSDDVKVFADVDNAEYYAQSVYTAVNEGYVEGMGGSNLFMPNSSMSRAQMVCMLYRMAGGEPQKDDWVAGPNEGKYLSQFSDVNGDEFFAQALAWATRAGVVTGYEDGTFGPADDVTVEQYVTMLARYAKVVGNYEAVDTDEVLSGVADGSQVSEFGQDAVAWAIESGYLAQGGADIQPQSPVTRGRAVTVAVRYQPAQADVIGK